MTPTATERVGPRKVVATVEARMASSRLPWKIRAPILWILNSARSQGPLG